MWRNCHIHPRWCRPGTGGIRGLTEVSLMQWQTPKLVEIACGCEINAYFPADL
jgi:coenzyme PQQ precursor peptide PqqA